MHSATKQNVMEHDVVQWIHAILSSKHIVTTQTGSMIRVLSVRSVYKEESCPLLRSLMAEGLLVQLNKSLYTQGYTDDLALLINRKSPSTV
jgi:hypothetical protein